MWNFIERAVWECRTLVIPLSLLIVVIGVLSFTGHSTSAWELSFFGTGVVAMANLAYVMWLEKRESRNGGCGG